MADSVEVSNLLAPVAILATLFAPIRGQEAAPTPFPAPAPGGETARRPTSPGSDERWSSAEATALAISIRIVSAQKAARAHGYRIAPSQLHRALPRAARRMVRRGRGTGFQFGGYRFALYAASSTGDLVPYGEPSDASADWCGYAWPAADPDTNAVTESGKVFFFTNLGPILFASNEPGYIGDNAPHPGAAFGRGATESLDSVLAGSGTGDDGQLWATLDTAPRTHCRVVVVDEHDTPIEDVTVLALPPGALRPAANPNPPKAFAIPSGMGTTDASGSTILTGPVGHSTILHVAIGPHVTPVQSVEQGPGTLKVVVSVEAIHQAQCAANEEAAIATLKNIASAQAQFRACGATDTDGDGSSEFGFLAELSGGVPLRGGRPALSPAVLSAAFQKVEQGKVNRSGYLFQIYLPDTHSNPVAEDPTGGSAVGTIGPKAAELMWCAYAWPVRAGHSGQRAFFINQAGDVMDCANTTAAYSGEKAPPPMAAFRKGSHGGLASAPAYNTTAVDGQRWTVVN